MGEARSRGDEIITPGKIVPYKCCLSSANISVKTDFVTVVLFNWPCHPFSASFCNVY